MNFNQKQKELKMNSNIAKIRISPLQTSKKKTDITCKNKQ